MVHRIHPFRERQDCNEEIDIEICKSVPKEFSDFIQDKELVYFKNTKHASPVIGMLDDIRNLGKINHSFIDEVTRQISEQLIDISGCNLSSKWDIRTREKTETIMIEGKKYRRFSLYNSRAEGISLGVCWEGNYDIGDYINRDVVKFELTETKFAEHVSSFEEIKEFIINKGFVWKDDKGKAISELNSRKNYDFQDTTIVIKSDKPIDDDSKDKILKYVAAFINKYNDGDQEEKIHDFFPVDSDEENEFNIYIDFGNCNPSVLDELLEYLKGIK